MPRNRAFFHYSRNTAKSVTRMDDGYIKYSSERHDGLIPELAGLDALNEVRTQLFDIGLIEFTRTESAMATSAYGRKTTRSSLRPAQPVACASPSQESSIVWSNPFQLKIITCVRGVHCQHHPNP
jgi:hypothetical protein